MYENLVGLFLHIQIKSYSEALCETVGSIMKMDPGRGRNIHPVNFNMEIYLRLNLHPLQEGIIDFRSRETQVSGRKEVISQTARKDKLKFGQFSYSVGNIRDKEDASSHLPVDSFKKDK